MNKKSLVNEITELQQQILHDMSKNEPMPWMELNLTLAQLKCLHFVYYGGSTNLIKLAKALHVTPPNVTGIVNRLVMRELVLRKENPEDRRTYMLSVTQKGKVLIEGLRESGIKHIVGILNRLTARELTALQTGFRALAREMRVSKE